MNYTKAFESQREHETCRERGCLPDPRPMPGKGAVAVSPRAVPLPPPPAVPPPVVVVCGDQGFGRGSRFSWPCVVLPESVELPEKSTHGIQINNTKNAVTKGYTPYIYRSKR